MKMNLKGLLNRYLSLFIFIVLIANVAGCAQLRRKLVRKKQPKKGEVSFYRVEEYKPKLAHERYQENYMLWHNWQLDLQRTDGTSRLRDVNAANEALRHLTAMRDLLEEEKAKELDVRIEEMNEILAYLKKRRRDVMADTRTRKTIERLERIIINEFTYNRMKDYIKAE